MPDAGVTQLIRNESEIGRWESAVRQPHVSLRPYVREYFGGSEDTFVPLCRRELPTEIAPLIINFGPPFRIVDGENKLGRGDTRGRGAGDSCDPASPRSAAVDAAGDPDRHRDARRRRLCPFARWTPARVRGR